MDIYRSWFESQLVAGQLTTDTISRGGAEIEGISATTSERLESLPVVRPLIDERIAGARLATTNAVKSRAGALDHVTETVIEDLESLRHHAASAVDAIESISRSYERDGVVDFGALEAVDRELMSHPASEIAGFLLQQSISDIDQGFGSKDVGEQLQASQLLYGQLLEATEFHLQELRTAQSA